jgi:hypothetical protein
LVPLISSLNYLVSAEMEAEEAGVALWPQLPMRPSNQSQAYPLSNSDSEAEGDTSRQISSTPNDKATKKVLIAEKRKRKAERAAERLAKKARKEARKSASGGGKEKEKEAVLVHPSSAPSRPTLSFPEVSTSPVGEEEKEDQDVSTQSIETAESQTTAPAVESAGQTESQDSASAPLSPSPSRLPGSGLLGLKANGQVKTYGRIREKSVEEEEEEEEEEHVEANGHAPSTQSTSGSSEIESTIPEQAEVETEIKTIAPKRTNAEAGPSTKKPKAAAPNTPRTSTKRSRNSGVSKKGSPQVEDDESLRRRLATPTAANEFIVSKYWPPPYLNRLETAGSKSASSRPKGCTDIQ